MFVSMGYPICRLHVHDCLSVVLGDQAWSSGLRCAALLAFHLLCGNKTGRAIPLSCSVGFSPFVLGPRLVELSPLRCSCQGHRPKERLFKTGQEVPRTKFSVIYPCIFLSPTCTESRWCWVSAALVLRPRLRLHLLLLSLRQGTLSLRTHVNHLCDGKHRVSFRISIPAIVYLVVYLSASGHTTGIVVHPGSDVSHTALIYDGQALVEGIVHQRYT